jgi:hypothetical protein
MRREQVLTVPCPKCGAQTGEPCIGMMSPRQERASPHIQRYNPESAARRRKAGCRKPTYLYVIGTTQGDGVKVGISRNLKARLAHLQIGSATKLKIHSAFSFPDRASALATERDFHKANADRCLNGEWFDFTAREVEVIIERLLKTP